MSDGVEAALVAVRLGVRDGVRVAVAGPGVTGVALGPVVGVLDGVGLGPEVGVDVRVGVRDGVRVADGVKVGVGVLVGVRVAVEVGEATGVFDAGEVDVAGGAVTVNVPPLRDSETGLAPGSEATALPGLSAEEPGAAPPLTLNDSEAMAPSGMAELPPWITIRTTPEDGCDQLSDLPAEEAALPIVTPATASRLESNETSNWMAETWIPESESSEAGMPIPDAPGAPEPEPMASAAPPV